MEYIADYHKINIGQFQTDDNLIDCDYINLKEENLSRANFINVSFQKANFMNSNLKDVNFKNANLSYATLTGAKNIKVEQISQARFKSIEIDENDKKNRAILKNVIEKIKKIKREKLNKQTEENEKEESFSNEKCIVM